MTVAPDSTHGFLQWTIILVFTALLLATLILIQTISTYATAYVAAPKDIVTFIDTVEFSIQENESYDRDVTKVQRLEDKVRLGQLLREIQKLSDDLREDLNSLVIGEGTTTLRMSARFLWASRRTQLEDRVRRLDLLRMRFLVVYMGIITSTAERNPPPPPPLPPPLEKAAPYRLTTPPHKPMLKKAATSHPQMKRGPPLRRLATQAIGHSETTGRTQKRGWAGVMEELQLSPKMMQRHASIEQAMAMEKAEAVAG
ncbi:uncharacterized protein F5Z01DRAFT_676267 [Emericellopsis atlantica]|uniref:Uncharacterized protein n=1 Tax=Emericellopsis atlantica TaxID=2614577 RepID=A0A9P7ZI67_9HYPO|nr:uncharacterized protein F5Z01DRAFT_676267 [Emericellopsis atlantica]KAG9252020.1 hypothetical protein F5Z01DRAFT_676267 [Emericellopsis atlantica]